MIRFLTGDHGHAFESFAPAVVLAVVGVGLIRLARWIAHGSIHADLGGED